MKLMPGPRVVFLIATIVLLLFGGLVYEVISTQPVRGTVRTCAELFTIANRNDLTDSERLSKARALCSTRYLQHHPLALAAEGGIVNIPRNINMHFKAWREGPDIWICPRDRVGPVYQFVFENGNWRFDGLIAYLGRYGEIVRSSDVPEPVPQ
jgi:hypothetical protein